MTPSGKLKATNDIYWILLEKAEELKIEPLALVSYIGQRLTYLKDRRMSKAFSDLGKGTFGYAVALPQATYLKSHLQLTVRKWTDLRLAMSDYLRLPTKTEITTYVNTFLPPKAVGPHFIGTDANFG